MRAGVDEYTEPSARRHPGLRCQRRQKAPEPTARRALQCLAFDLGGRWLLARHASIDDFVADQEGAGGPHRIMHDKFFIIDGRGVWTGSANISGSDTGGYSANLVAAIESAAIARLTR